MIFNACLFLLITGLAVTIKLQERELPGSPPIREAQQRVDQIIKEERQSETEASRSLSNFGKKNIFDDLIPMPTPTVPPPTPTPAPPSCDELTQYWKCNAVLKGIAMFQNLKTNKEFTLQSGQFQPEVFRGKEYKIYLESTNFKKFTATVVAKEGDKEVCRRTFDMFE